MVVRCELKISSLGITVQPHSASFVMPNSYPCDGIVNPNLTTIDDSHSLTQQNKAKSNNARAIALERPI